MHVSMHSIGLFNIDDTKEADTDEYQQTQVKKIAQKDITILKETQKKYNLTDEQVREILSKFSYKTFSEVTYTDYAKVGNAMSELGGKK